MRRRGGITGGNGLREKGWPWDEMRKNGATGSSSLVSPGTMIHRRAPSCCSVPLDFRVLAMDSRAWPEDAWG